MLRQVFKKGGVFGLAVCLMAGGTAFANQTPHALSTDGRMRVVAYNPNNVVTVVGHALVATSLEFGTDETVQGVEGGDAAAWDVVVNPSHPNLLFLKPTLDHSDTNLTVLTNQHVYHFHLVMPAKKPAGALTAPTYHIRFIYPEVDAQKALAAAARKKQMADASVSPPTDPFQWNWRYTYSRRCARDNVPIKALDDGRFTYFQFAPNAPIPAIFWVDGAGHESLANWHLQGPYVVIERMAGQFSLRNGDVVSCVFNETYTAGKS